MSGGGRFQDKLIPMHAFGRHFKLGDLYDYRSDRIWTDGRLSWGPEALSVATRVSSSCSAHFLQNSSSEMNAINDDRATVVIAGFDSHLQMSYVAGLMENTENPISYYLNDRPDPGQATCTIGCRATCREENLDLLSLVNQQVPHLLTAAENEEDRESSATHVVTSVLYGAEVYCILAQDIDADEDAQKEIENNLSLLAGKWSKALSELEDPVIFKKKFTSQEKHLITQLRCRLYAPLQTEPMTECSYLESYAKSFQVMQTLFTFPEDVANSKAVPVVIKLCPLNCILAASKQMAKFSYRDVGYSAVQRYSLLFAKLNRIVLSAENIRRVMQKPCDSESLQQFLDLVFKFQGFLKTNTKQSVVVARNASYSSDAAVHSTLQDAEKHLLFKPSVLNQWLKRKTEEMDIAYWMEKAAGTGIEFLSKDKLENHLRNSLDYSVVLFVPEERTSAILAAMKNCADNLQEFGLCGHEGNDDGQSWYNNPLQKKLVFDKIQQLAAHVERNKNNISKPVNYIVSFSGSSNPLTCSYSVYKGGELLKGKIRRLPGEPTGLSVFSLPVPSANTRQAKRAKTSFSSIRLEWDYELLDYPCSFVVVYRLAGSSDSWVQQKTEQSEVVIDFETGTDVEMLVAAETCIGRSKFSEIVDTTSAVELPDVELDIPSAVLPPTGLESILDSEDSPPKRVCGLCGGGHRTSRFCSEKAHVSPPLPIPLITEELDNRLAEGASPSVYLKQLVDFGLSDDELFRRVKSRFRGGRFFWQTKWLSINLSNTQTLVRIMKGE